MNSEQYFGFLHYLRDSGAINMFLAPTVLRDTFGLSKKESYEVFFAWNETFKNGEFGGAE
jgi:hypothetical protein